MDRWQHCFGLAFKKYFTGSQRAEEGIELVLHEGKVTNYELAAGSKEVSETVVSDNASGFRNANSKRQGASAARRATSPRGCLPS